MKREDVENRKGTCKEGHLFITDGTTPCPYCYPKQEQRQEECKHEWTKFSFHKQCDKCGEKESLVETGEDLPPKSSYRQDVDER